MSHYWHVLYPQGFSVVWEIYVIVLQIHIMFGVDFISHKYIGQRDMIYMPLNVYSTYFWPEPYEYVYGAWMTQTIHVVQYMDTFVE